MSSVWGWSIVALAALGAGALGTFLYFELRNQFKSWNDPCVTPAETRADIVATAEAIRSVLAGRNIVWWLDFGTLLGAWRIGETMAFDHDLDLSYLAGYDQVLRDCASELAARGVTIDIENGRLFYQGRRIGDFERWFRHGDKLCREDPATRRLALKIWRPLVDDFPAAWVEPTWGILFHGAVYPCPSQPKLFLRRRYLLCRLHLRFVFPRKWGCWRDPQFWHEVSRIWNEREFPRIEERANPARLTA